MEVSVNKQIYIETYTNWLTKQVFASDYLYPSNYDRAPIADLGDLTASLTDINIFKKRKVETFTHSGLKPVRFVARFVALYSIRVLALVGVLVNLTYVIKYSLQGGDQAKINAYAQAAFHDFFSSAVCFGGLALTAYAISSLSVAITVSAIIYLVIGSLTQLGFLWMSADPSQCSVLVESSNEKVSFIKSVFFKNYYGLTAEGGALLSWDKEIDAISVAHEAQDAFLNTQWMKCWEQILSHIIYVQKALFQAKKANLDPNEFFLDKGCEDYYPDTHFTIDYRKIIERIRKDFPGNNDTINGVKINEWVRRFEELYLDAEKLSQFMSVCYTMRKGGILITLICPYTHKELAELFQSRETPEEKKWKETRDELITDLLAHSCFEHLGGLQVKLEPWQILLLEEKPTTELKINGAYRKLAKLFHSDKVGTTSETSTIFNFIIETKNLLLAQLAWYTGNSHPAPVATIKLLKDVT